MKTYIRQILDFVWPLLVTFLLVSPYGNFFYIQEVIVLLAIIDVYLGNLHKWERILLLLSCFVWVFGELYLPYFKSHPLGFSVLIVYLFAFYRALLLVFRAKSKFLSDSKPSKSFCVGAITSTILLASMMGPSFLYSRPMSDPRVCYANQKVLLGANEMYHFDHKSYLDLSLTSNIQKLIDGKYLHYHTKCLDKKGTNNHYFWDFKKSLVCCKLHGCHGDNN